MYQLNPASLDQDSNKEDIKSIYKRSNSNSKTYKNKKTVNFAENTQSNNSKSNINSILSKLHINDENIDNDNDDNNFRQYHNNDKEFIENDKLIKNDNLNKPTINKTPNYVSENYSNPNKILSNFDDSYQDNLVYYNNENQPISYNNNTPTHNNKELLSKLEYIIQLLEDQHNEKTNHIVEELILYLFLGIFIIFVLDSFSKATKYTR